MVASLTTIGKITTGRPPRSPCNCQATASFEVKGPLRRLFLANLSASQGGFPREIAG